MGTLGFVNGRLVVGDYFDSTHQVNILTTSQLKGLVIKGTHADDGPVLKLFHYPGEPEATDDIIGRVQFTGTDSIGTLEVDYAYIDAICNIPDTGAEYGDLYFKTMANGAVEDKFRIRQAHFEFLLSAASGSAGIHLGDVDNANMFMSYFDIGINTLTERLSRNGDDGDFVPVFRSLPHDCFSDDFMSAWANMTTPTILHSEVPWTITEAKVTVLDVEHGVIQLLPDGDGDSAYIRTMQKSMDADNFPWFGAWINIEDADKTLFYFDITDTVGGAHDTGNYVRLLFDGAGGQYDGGTVAKRWYGEADDNIGVTTDDNAIAVTDGKHFVYVDITGAAEALFFVDGVEVAAVTGNIPVDVDLYLTIFAKNQAVGDWYIQVDKIFLTQPPDTGYW